MYLENIEDFEKQSKEQEARNKKYKPIITILVGLLIAYIIYLALKWGGYLPDIIDKIASLGI